MARPGTQLNFGDCERGLCPTRIVPARLRRRIVARELTGPDEIPTGRTTGACWWTADGNDPPGVPDLFASGLDDVGSDGGQWKCQQSHYDGVDAAALGARRSRQGASCRAASGRVKVTMSVTSCAASGSVSARVPRI